MKYINLYPLDKLLVLSAIYLFITKQVLLKLNIYKPIINDNKTIIVSFIVFLASVIVLFPIKFYLSSPEEVECSIKQIIFTGLCLFIILSLISSFIIYKGKNLTHLVIIFIIICSTINLLFPLKPGIISGFELSLNKLFKSVSFENFIKDAFIGITSIIIIYFIYKKNRKYLTYISIIIFCIPLLQIVSILHKNNIQIRIKNHNNTNITSLPEEYYKMHSLSKDKPNIIYICLDMFNGEYIESLEKDIEDFDEIFKGFIYYKDTLSVSGWTITSFGGALYYGDQYSPINNNLNKISVKDSGKEALTKLKELLIKNNYKANFINDIILNEIPVSNEGPMSDFAYYWSKKNKEKITSVSKLPMLEMLSIFQAAPIMIKNYIYNDANWLVYGDEVTFAMNRYNAIKTYSYLDLLPELSSNTSDKSNFLSIRTELSHQPYGLDKNGELIFNNYADTENNSFYSSKAAYYSAKGTILLLIKYFDWMKQNGVYDNSIIILYSDHGNNCHDNNIPTPENEEEKEYYSRSNALYMIKPLNSNDDFKIDLSLKSNGDILYDVFNLLGIENDIQPCTKDGIRYYSFMKSLEDTAKNKNYVDYASYEVNGSIFDKDSWERIN